MIVSFEFSPDYIDDNDYSLITKGKGKYMYYKCEIKGVIRKDKTNIVFSNRTYGQFKIAFRLPPSIFNGENIYFSKKKNLNKGCLVFTAIQKKNN